MALAMTACRSPVPYFPEPGYPDPPWTQAQSTDITVRYIPFDHPPRPLKPLTVRSSVSTDLPDTVRVLVFIHEDGDASDPTLLNDTLPTELTNDILDAVLSMDYRPALQNDHPIAAWVEIPVQINKQ